MCAALVEHVAVGGDVRAGQGLVRRHNVGPPFLLLLAHRQEVLLRDRPEPKIVADVGRVAFAEVQTEVQIADDLEFGD